MTHFNDRHTIDGVDLDRLFNALSHAARRRILTALADDDPRWLEEFTGSGDDAAMVDLHHRHLPKLDDDGFINWDRDTGRVLRGKHFEVIRPFVELLDSSLDWSNFDGGTYRAT